MPAKTPGHLLHLLEVQPFPKETTACPDGRKPFLREKGQPETKDQKKQDWGKEKRAARDMLQPKKEVCQ